MVGTRFQLIFTSRMGLMKADDAVETYSLALCSISEKTAGVLNGSMTTFQLFR